MLRHFLIVLRAVAIAAMCCVACAPPSPGPEIQTILDEVAPGLTIGEHVSAAARRKYKLIVTSPSGYTDPFYVSPQGLTTLQVMVDVLPETAGSQMSAAARIESVSLHAPHEAILNPIVQRFRTSLGEPETECYSFNNAWRWRRHYWRGARGRGLLVVISRGAVDGAASQASGDRPDMAPPAAGIVTFGARAGKQVGVDPEPCS